MSQQCPNVCCQNTIDDLHKEIEDLTCQLEDMSYECDKQLAENDRLADRIAAERQR